MTGRPLREHRTGVRALLALIVGSAFLALTAIIPASSATAATAPSAPTGVVGTPRDSAVAVSWVAPANGGSAITGYRLRYSTDSGRSWSSTLTSNGTATTYTVTKLRNGRSYVFQVRAVNRIGNSAWSASSASVVAGLPAPPPQPATQRVAVPSYVYPGGVWSQLEQGAPTVGLSIINPRSGPGAAVDANYVAQVKSTRAKGIKVMGYVDTSYSLRSLATVRADIDKHFAWYGVDGIFLDQVTTSCVSRFTDYYADLYQYVQRKGGTVVLNPGTNPGECYMTSSDVVVTFENLYDWYSAWQPAGWENKYAASRFWHLVYSADDRTQLTDVVGLSKSRNVGWIYVTDDVLDNPWDTLPSFWSEELALVGG